MDKFFEYLRDNFNIKLNDQQRQAVEHTLGPALVLAGPGAGKTTVLICRAAYLILSRGVKPSNILSITYNRAAALEMDGRFERVFGCKIQGGIRFSTIHSLAYNIFISYAKSKNMNFTLIEDASAGVNKKMLLKDIYRQVNNEQINDDKLESLISALSYVKNGMIKDLKGIDMDTKNFNEIYETYEQIKKKNNYIDFDDMLTNCYGILRDNPAVLRAYQQKYQYIQVDEGQDNSKIQTEIIKLISGGAGNLYIVADDDQSIYGFRGAQPDYLLQFKDHYPKGRIYYLEHNYRSTKNIVDISSKFIKINKRRFDKDHKTQNSERVNPQIITLKTDRDQLDYLYDKVVEIRGKDGSCRETAILFRNNLSSLPIADLFARRGIPFYLRESNINFSSHWCIGDILGFLYHSLNPYDGESFLKIYYKMNRYLSKTMVEYGLAISNSETIIERIARFPELQPFQRERMKETRIDFAILSGMKPPEAIDYVLDVFEYGRFAQEFCKKFGYSHRYVKEMIANLVLISRGCETLRDFLQRMDDLEDILNSSRFNKNKDAVTLSTIHSAKGLEFKNVFIIDLIEEILPASASIEALEELQDDGPMEEERRLFYVGITRPKEALYLVTYGLKNGDKVAISRFVLEIMECMHQNINDELGQGSIIHHKSFGKGIVISVEPSIKHNTNTLKVKFQCGIKDLDLGSCLKNGIITING